MGESEMDDGERLYMIENAAWSTAFAYVAGRQDLLNDEGRASELPIMAAGEFADMWAKRHRDLAERGVHHTLYVRNIKQHFDAWLAARTEGANEE
jgi:hypothetical protein